MQWIIPDLKKKRSHSNLASQGTRLKTHCKSEIDPGKFLIINSLFVVKNEFFLGISNATFSFCIYN